MARENGALKESQAEIFGWIVSTLETQDAMWQIVDSGFSQIRMDVDKNVERLNRDIERNVSSLQHNIAEGRRENAEAIERLRARIDSIREGTA